ncbi:MAG: aldehyde dehydrogenase family protein, partial [Solimonas sp.]
MRAHEIPPGVLPTRRELYYGGAWHTPKAGGYAETINPAYNETITTAPLADEADVDAAVQAAHAAFPAWAATPPVERGRYLRKAA